jgi:hypothetical protein
MSEEFGKKHMKVAACESPFERLRGSLIAALESHQGPPERAGVCKVARRKATPNNERIDGSVSEVGAFAERGGSSGPYGGSPPRQAGKQESHRTQSFTENPQSFAERKKV